MSNGKPIFAWDNWAQNCARTVVAYLVFSSARERLYLTYQVLKNAAQEVKPSPYFKNIQKI